MAGFFLHLYHLLSTALLFSFDAMGTTLLARIAALLLLSLVEFRRYRLGGISAMKANWKGDFLFTFVAALAIWFLVFSYQVISTIYKDHVALRDLANARLEIIQGKDGEGGLRKQLADAQKGIEVEEAMIKSLRNEPPKVVMNRAPKTAAPVSASSAHASVEATKADLPALSQERGDGSPEHPALTEADCPPGTRETLINPCTLTLRS